ncbi:MULTISPECIES: XVIPCD domain-containing protein [unclassified Lysobacter]|uniref:XVIPCD domain-containing protein n=1 Tax=unclassified Lysobacter TaxID=2635362 RepID=UPI0009E80151|nr:MULTISPECIES: XVIPCD domain-containing protein [unclassified Lysobacter]
MPELDINASADEVVALLNRGQNREAAARLDALRLDQDAVVQESLDRYVAVRAQERLTALRAPDALSGEDATALNPTLERLRGATAAPRFPTADETRELSQAQQYDVYASVIGTRGNQAARDALNGQDRVILGLRNETQTTERNGQGVYDDRIAVVWKDANGERHAREFNSVTTEPTAQYDHHAGSDGNRIYADTQRQAPRLEASPGYEDVTRRKIEGDDVNGDDVRDLGRLGEGTTEMLQTTHPRRNHPAEFSLRPTPEAVRDGAGRVQRDTNADGWFDARDVGGVQDLNNTFKIHRGSNNNTDSAGCQTIGGGEYDAFVTTVRGNENQTRWQYVLTSVAPAQQQERAQPEAGQARPQGEPAQPPAREGAQPPARENAPNGEQEPARHPSDPRHVDHRMHGQIDGHVRALGEPYTQRVDEINLSLLNAAKINGLTQVDHVAPNRATDQLRAGEMLFLVQGRMGDPAAQRVALSVDVAANTPAHTSLARLDAFNQTAAQEPALAQPAQSQSQTQDSPVRRMG